MSGMNTDFISAYMDYRSGTEVPDFFTRWAIIGALGAFLERRTWITHADAKIYPNMYIMLLGPSGSRKSSAIKQAAKFIRAAGYTTFAAEKTSKEKFLMDLAGAHDNEAKSLDEILSSPFDTETEDKSVFIAADEFNDFFGNNILEFVSTLGVLWDYDGDYENRIKNGKSIVIRNPTVSILAGNTQITFANTFPPEVIGQGFFSRLIAVFSESTKLRIAFPMPPPLEKKEALLQFMQNIKDTCIGEMKISLEAHLLMKKIYETWQPLEDVRFAAYCERRFTHLMKMAVVHTAARCSMEILVSDVLYANTILTHTEHYMPRAFGAFGQAKNAMITHKILQIIEEAKTPPTFDEVWSLIQSEADSLEDLSKIIRGLVTGGKVQIVESYLLPRKKKIHERFDDLVDYRLLTPQERGRKNESV